MKKLLILIISLVCASHMVTAADHWQVIHTLADEPDLHVNGNLAVLKNPMAYNEAIIYDETTRQPKHTISTIPGYIINQIGFSSDSKLIVMSSMHMPLNYLANTISIWNPNAGKCLAQFEHDGFPVNATLNTDKTITTEFAGHQAYTGPIRLGDIMAATYNHDGSQLMTTARNQTMQIWDAKSGKCIRILDNTNYELSNYKLSQSFKPDKTHTVISKQRGSNITKQFRMKADPYFSKILAETGPIDSAELNHNGTEMVIVSNNGDVQIWQNIDEINRRKNQGLAFACALHRRLGEDSPACTVPQYLMQEIICQYIYNSKIDNFEEPHENCNNSSEQHRSKRFKQ